MVESECLPETKLRRLDSLEKSTVKTAMVGDGINDAPALARSSVGIAMGGIGSDIAVNAADMVLVRDDVRLIPWLIGLGRRMMRMIMFNMTLAMGINFVAIIFAATGLMGPVAGALVHNAGSVLVILNWGACCARSLRSDARGFVKRDVAGAAPAMPRRAAPARLCLRRKRLAGERRLSRTPAGSRR